MTKKPTGTLKAGPLAHRYALGHLSYLVRQDQEFIAARRGILDRFPLLESLDQEQASTFFEFLRYGMGTGLLSEQLEQLMDEVRSLAARYTYDKITDGEYFMFQMVATGGPPRLWEFGDTLISTWKPTFIIEQGDTFEEVVRRVERDLRKVWEQVAAARKEGEWAEHFLVADLNEKVEWYFALKIKRTPLREVAARSSCSESPIRRGVRQVQRLLRIPPDPRGRPRKNDQRLRP